MITKRVMSPKGNEGKSSMTNSRRRRLAVGALAFGAAVSAGTALGAPAHASTTSGIATAYKLTVIKAGTITGAGTDAFGISNSGEVFGTGDQAGVETGFVLPAGSATARFLPQPAGALSGSISFPEAMNNAGNVVGDFTTQLDNTNAVQWTGGTTTTDLSNAINTATGFGGGDGEDTVANGINDNGLAVVTLTEGNIEDGLTVQGNTATALPGLPGGGSRFGTNANPIAVNNNNLIVGSAQDSAGQQVAAEWQNGKITNLGGLPGSSGTEALAVNSSGLAVGASTLGNEHAVEFVNGKAVDLNVGGNGDAMAKAVNDSGVIVGTDGNDAFASANGKYVNLNTLIPANSGVTLAIANGINANGVIVGTATVNGSQQTVGFELTPVS